MPVCLKPTLIQVKPKNAEPYRMYVACQKCNFCLQDRRNGWAIRLTQELKRAMTAKFITLTYNSHYLPTTTYKYGQRNVTTPTLVKKHLTTWYDTICTANRRYLKSISKSPEQYAALLKRYSPKYYGVGEYGSNFNRPHYHAILFNVHPNVLVKLNERRNFQEGEIEKGSTWNYGHIDVGSVTAQSINYVAKYMIDRKKEYTKKQPQFAVMSKGLGSNYLVNAQWHKAKNPENWRTYIMHNGKKLKLPRYYKDQIFSPEERKIYGELGQKKNDQLLAEKLKPFVEKFGRDEGYFRFQDQRKWEHDLIRIKSLNSNSLHKSPHNTKFIFSKLNQLRKSAYI